jgi:hypothetical protein
MTCGGVIIFAVFPYILCLLLSPPHAQRPWFRKYFPVFMKYITGGFVGEEEAGQRLSQVIVDPRCTRSGVYWSWNGGPRKGEGCDTMDMHDVGELACRYRDRIMRVTCTNKTYLPL